MAAHSYSSLKQFDTCPRQYHEIRILKNFPKPKSEQIIWGETVHKECEAYIKENKPFEIQFPGADSVAALKALDGQKYCEMELAVNGHLEPVSFRDSTAIIRGIADLVILRGNKCRVVDYKTGSAKYPDVSQLELMSLLLFSKFPEVQQADGALLFLAHDTIINHVTKRENTDELWVKWFSKIKRLEQAHESGVWNPKPNGLCRKWCDVITCEHNGRK